MQFVVVVASVGGDVGAEVGAGVVVVVGGDVIGVTEEQGSNVVQVPFPRQRETCLAPLLQV